MTADPANQARFDYQQRTRIVFGDNQVDRVGELAADLGGTRVVLVTDAGILAAGHAERVRQSLARRVEAVGVFSEVRENPSTLDVERCLAVAREMRADLIVGLGGGSSMDTAKGCNFLLTNGGRMQDYWGVGKASGPMLPFIAIPTTAGTGSECQSAALIAEEGTHQKMACLDPKAAARIAILDPALTLSQPPRVTALTGIDAIAHAVETAVTTRRNPLSLMHSREAFRLLTLAFPRVLSHPGDAIARGRMLLGAALAGSAIEQSMLGAAHAAANPLTARYGMAHGQAVGMMLPLVVQFNAQDRAARLAYAELVSDPQASSVEGSDEEVVARLVARLQYLLNLAGLPRSLAGCGVAMSDIDALAEEAARQWTAAFNPRPVISADFEALYIAACESRGEGCWQDGVRDP